MQSILRKSFLILSSTPIIAPGKVDKCKYPNIQIFFGQNIICRLLFASSSFLIGFYFLISIQISLLLVLDNCPAWLSHFWSIYLWLRLNISFLPSSSPYQLQFFLPLMHTHTHRLTHSQYFLAFV